MSCTRSRLAPGLFAAVTLLLLCSGCASRPDESAGDAQHRHEAAAALPAFPVPSTLKAEHEELHEGLARAIESGGKTGVAAQRVESLLHPHFLKEEQLALPPLGALATLREGRVTEAMRPLVDLGNRLRAEYPAMLQEHEEIGTALGELAAAARDEGKMDVVAWADNLKAHARNEEEVLYPAAIVVGDYVKAKLGR